MTRRPTPSPADPLQVLHPLQLRRADPEAFTREARFRVAPAAAGLVASLVRRRLRHARVRTWATDGLLVRGELDAEALSAEAGEACVQALREAACLAADVPVTCGTFGLDGVAVHVEISACHDGARAFVHLGGADEALRDPLLELIDAADLDALQAIHGATLLPEDFFALRRCGRWADVGSLLVRHCDVTLLGLSRGIPSGSHLLSLLHQVIGECLRSARWRLALEPMSECARFCRAAEPDAADPIRATMEAWWSMASPAIRQGLRAASQASEPPFQLDPD